MDSKQDADRFELLRIASADMARLTERTGEAVALALVAGAEAIYVDEIDRPEARGAGSRIDRRVPLWRTAIGKALAANLDAGARRSLIDEADAGQLARAGFAGPQALAAHLDLVRARGYAIDVDEFIPGIACVAAPIIGPGGWAVAAMAVEGPSERLPRGKLHELAPALIEATRGASLHAGGALRPTSKLPRPSQAVSPRVKVLADTQNLIGEGPIFDAVKDRLYWVDMYEPTVFRLDRKSRELVAFSPGEMVMALALVPGGLLMAAQSGLWLIDPDTGDRIRSLGHPERHIPSNRFNDGKCDSRGRFWVNTIDLDFGANAGALYRMDPDGGFVSADTGLTLPNGMGWSPDNRTMYLVETTERAIYAYDFSEESGRVSNRRILVRIPDDASGAPDGLTVDEDGNLWVALFDGWRVSQFSPEGRLIQEIVLPVPRPTSCILGGQDNRTLFVTSARIRVSESTLKVAPHSGAVFEVHL